MSYLLPETRQEQTVFAQLSFCVSGPNLYTDSIRFRLPFIPSVFFIYLSRYLFLGCRQDLLQEYNAKLGGEIFFPVTGGGHTSDEVMDWMTEVFCPPTSTGMTG